MSRIARDRHIVLEVAGTSYAMNNQYILIVEPLKACKRYWRIYQGQNLYGPFIASGVAGMQDNCKAIAVAALTEALSK